MPPLERALALADREEPARSRRRGSGPRCAAGARRRAPRTRGRPRSRTSPRSACAGTPRPPRSATGRRACPCRRRPAAALRRSGKPFSRPKAAISSADAAGVVMPGDDGNARREHPLAGLGLAAHRADRRARADPREPGVDHGLRERGVLGQEAEARVEHRRAGPLRRVDGASRGRGTLARGRRPDRDGVVREAHVERAAVGLGVDGDRRDPEVAAGADDPDRDLAAVRDEERAGSPEGRGSRDLSIPGVMRAS